MGLTIHRHRHVAQTASVASQVQGKKARTGSSGLGFFCFGRLIVGLSRTQPRPQRSIAWRARTVSVHVIAI